MLRKGHGSLYQALTMEERRKRKARRREVRSSLLILDLKDGKLYDSGKQEEGFDYLVHLWKSGFAGW